MHPLRTAIHSQWSVSALVCAKVVESFDLVLLQWSTARGAHVTLSFSSPSCLSFSSFSFPGSGLHDAHLSTHSWLPNHPTCCYTPPLPSIHTHTNFPPPLSPFPLPLLQVLPLLLYLPPLSRTLTNAAFTRSTPMVCTITRPGPAINKSYTSIVCVLARACACVRACDRVCQ